MSSILTILEITGDTNWYPDSRATNHATPNLNNLVTNMNFMGQEKLHMGNGTSLFIHYIGLSCFKSQFQSKTLSLNQLLHVPLISKNLISVSKFARNNKVYFEFHLDVCFVKDQVSQANLMEGQHKNGLYAFSDSQLGLTFSSTNASSSKFVNCAKLVNIVSLSNVTCTSLFYVWHNKLAHPSS